MVCNKFLFCCNHSEMYEMSCVVISGLTFVWVLSVRSWNSVAFIEASLEELPVSANLGQSFLATKISAPGPSSFGWFCHTVHRRRASTGHLLALQDHLQVRTDLLSLSRTWPTPPVSKLAGIRPPRASPVRKSGQGADCKENKLSRDLGVESETKS